MDHTTNYTNWNQSEDVRWFSHAKILLPRSLRSTIEENNKGLGIEMTANGLAWILQRPWMKYNHLQVNMPKDPAKSHYDLWLISDSKYMVAWTIFLQIFRECLTIVTISIPVHTVFNFCIPMSKCEIVIFIISLQRDLRLVIQCKICH